MPIVCLEGPSAVGKTRACAEIARRTGAAVVPEVNQLFVRPVPEPPNWYLERQVQRWAMAREAAASHSLVLLDGDPFQPYWYGWSYGFEGLQPLESLDAFYRARVEQGELSFPELYVILSAEEDTLRRHRAQDTTRRRGKFEVHLRLLQTIPRYFHALEHAAPGRVAWVDAGVGGVTTEILRAIQASPGALQRARELLGRMSSWLSTHQP